MSALLPTNVAVSSTGGSQASAAINFPLTAAGVGFLLQGASVLFGAPLKNFTLALLTGVLTYTGPSGVSFNYTVNSNISSPAGSQISDNVTVFLSYNNGIVPPVIAIPNSTANVLGYANTSLTASGTIFLNNGDTLQIAYVTSVAEAAANVTANSQNISLSAV